ncbi:hypothetical protein SJAG_00377 [Schizosaccharomyces japonicus yFS275]|uniref:Uncharacterized protein n=1 Tax=Schizosaccharomyces japonicus (strain yFS275 / FY16936) TaxID=402676 RepID=B6JVG6_SCHJY|nr:hypothetical protein SJAG_00377 [Schizosaccharomyces japonicus yFS275]EEB05367.1 hypothetical protein SJAG_00377 [Schizosaccharomyces japonicus yFS275]
MDLTTNDFVNWDSYEVTYVNALTKNSKNIMITGRITNLSNSQSSMPFYTLKLEDNTGILNVKYIVSDASPHCKVFQSLRLGDVVHLYSNVRLKYSISNEPYTVLNARNVDSKLIKLDKLERQEYDYMFPNPSKLCTLPISPVSTLLDCVEGSLTTALVAIGWMEPISHYLSQPNRWCSSQRIWVFDATGEAFITLNGDSQIKSVRRWNRQTIVLFHNCTVLKNKGTIELGLRSATIYPNPEIYQTNTLRKFAAQRSRLIKRNSIQLHTFRYLDILTSTQPFENCCRISLILLKTRFAQMKSIQDVVIWSRNAVPLYANYIEVVADETGSLHYPNVSQALLKELIQYEPIELIQDENQTLCLLDNLLKYRRFLAIARVCATQVYLYSLNEEFK